MPFNRKTITAPAVLVISLSVTVLAADFNIPWFSIDGGGAILSTGGDYELSGTIGQPDASYTMTGGNYELTGGFWALSAPDPEPVPGDCDGDYDVDLNDFADFDYCLWGPDAGLNTGCECLDFDQDNDVDLDDFASFQQSFGM